MKYYLKLLILLIVSVGFFWGPALRAMEDSGLARYALEYNAAIVGQDWYDSVYVPTNDEVEGAHALEVAQIKIRLPIDLKRIFDEYRQHKKPISLAVACGDRELPWRANTAALYNDSSRPNDDSDWQDFSRMHPINYDGNSENFISIDPLLGIPASILEGSARNSNLIGRGAGHLVMDAMNLDNWRQLASFLEKQNIKIHQIIFTTPMGSPTSTLEFKPEFFAVQLSMLEPTGKLVEPYFLNGNHAEQSFHSLRSLLHQHAFGNEWHLLPFWLGGEVRLSDIFSKTGYFIYNGKDFDTRSLHFIELFIQCSQGNDISENLLGLIGMRFPDASFNFKRLLYNLSCYYLSIFNIEVFSQKLSFRSVFLIDSQQKQMEKLIPFYKEYYAAQGLHAQFVTSVTQAMTLNNVGIEAQKWEKGEYPYGERGHIALVLSKIN